MLLSVMTAKKNLIAALTAASIAAVPAAPALAWGEKEQGFVAGVAPVTDRLGSSRHVEYVCFHRLGVHHTPSAAQ